MIRFTKLRVSGFKSFVEPVDILIKPGLTGIVGPNGCGKSNLAEALRWVMGETSARQMRGAEMDDVIFGGSGGRPPRNLAEVTLFLDNSDRSAPIRFNDFDELEVIRRIERGQGSGYRVNGRDVRARDVQTLFSDLASGARSTALVSQGRVNALIAAKPVERRSLLEEAAGIGGLHARRHEASQRLKAAETNLERLVDILQTLDNQLQGLKRQARQAARYRTLSERIANAEARLLSQRWMTALSDLDTAHTALKACDVQVGHTAAETARLTTELENAEIVVPPLRQAEAESSARLHRLHAAREQLNSEEARLDEMLEEQRDRCHQVDKDIERGIHRLEDATSELESLEVERQQIEEEKQQESGEFAQTQAALAVARADVEAKEMELSTLLEQAAVADAERAALMRRVTDMENRKRRLLERERELQTHILNAEAEQVDQADITSAEMEVEAAREYQEETLLHIEEIETRRLELVLKHESARERLLEQESTLARLQAESDALRALLGEETPVAGATPLLDEIIPQSGYEAAVGASIGDDLSVPNEGDGPVRWHELPPLDGAPPLPEGSSPLSLHVTAPPVLSRRLSQIGLVPDTGVGTSLHSFLRPGQRLVTHQGDVWRWDGLIRTASAPSAAASRLRHKARFREIGVQLDDAEDGLQEAQTVFEKIKTDALGLAEDEKKTRVSLREAEAELSQTQTILSRLTQKAAEAVGHLQSLVNTLADVRLDLEDNRSEEEEIRLLLAERDEGGKAREQLSRLRAETAESRTALSEAQSACERLAHQSTARTQRIKNIMSSVGQWKNRLDVIQQQQSELEARRIQAGEDLARLTTLPDEIDERRTALLEKLECADQNRQAAAISLEQAEKTVAEVAKLLKAAERDAATAREEKIRHEGQMATCAQACQTIADHIVERFSCSPEQLTARISSEIAKTENVSSDELEELLSRLQRDRDVLGAVNLLAEQEAAELEEQIGSLNAERADLTAAIERLNRAISELNREGRQRLLSAFQLVDDKFQSLFMRLFGGGRAHLSLIDSTDPLGAGLEIIASPPGKRLQSLSLLSGGEQALTALALLFAVFLVNPAPICVLDEVDAPLDDANVDRFCSLAAEISSSSQTRFMIVTHHRMTMARMDRLFGVTMIERGISQVVSVDLDEAMTYNEAASII